MCVERIDESLAWDLMEEMVNTTLLCKKATKIIPFVANRGIFMGDNWAEARWLNAHGTIMIMPNSLVFHG